MLENPVYQVYILSDTEKKDIKAFVSTWNLDSFVFIEHFAVNPSYRNLGIGSRILQELINFLEKTSCIFSVRVLYTRCMK